MEQKEFTYRQAMNVSGDKQEMFQRKEQLLSEWMGWAFRVFTAVSHPQSSYVSLHTIPILKVRKQNGGLQEMPLQAGILQHAHCVCQRPYAYTS